MIVDCRIYNNFSHQGSHHATPTIVKIGSISVLKKKII